MFSLGSECRLLACAVVFAAAGAHARDLNDLHFGEALFHAEQGHYFEALERLDAELEQHRGLDEPELDSLYPHIEHAEFSVGDFELSYRMHHRAGRAIRAVLEADVEAAVRNEAAYRLARIHFQKGQMGRAIDALDRIEGRVPEMIRDDVPFLRANVYLAMDKPAEAAAILEKLASSKGLAGFGTYNLGIALLRDGRSADGLRYLDRAGLTGGGDAATLAIRDKANLVLGTVLLDAAVHDRAKDVLDRVRLDGPLSNQALLGAGWAALRSGQVERALVPWSLLVERNPTDRSVQEALLALPHAYGTLGIHGRAAVLYGEALELFGLELRKLDSSIDSIDQGLFLEALIREEIRQDTDWVIRLRELPEAPETYYLMELLASHDFQTALQNYLDLEALRTKLAGWEGSFDAFEDLIVARSNYYQPLLPRIDQQFRELDSRIRLRREQHAILKRRLAELLVVPRPEFLATTDERVMADNLVLLEAAGAGNHTATMRVKRLQGILTFTLRTEYDERLTRFDRNLRELNESMARLDEQYESFVRVRQAALHSYVGFDAPIGRLRTRVASKLEEIGVLMRRQGDILEQVAVQELRARRERVAQYHNQVRYAMADSYDRAARAQALGAR